MEAETVSLVAAGKPSGSGSGSIALAHGGGGQLTDELVHGSVLPRLGNSALQELLDSGIVASGGQRTALTIDAYVVQPLEFPGGDIGRLAISGTVNDLAVCGAKPAGIALSFILAEGLKRSLLERVLDSIARTAAEADVKVITGDTKVVGRDQADGMYITTAGIGFIDGPRRLHPEAVREGDVIVINGPVGDHGLAVMLAREMPQVHSVLRSDVAPLNGLIAQVLAASDGVVFMRDPTRGGLAGLGADLAQRSGFHVVFDEAQLPIRPQTRHAADMLGLDVLEVANEGLVMMVVQPQAAQTVLRVMQSHERGREARVIGTIEGRRDGLCEMRTVIGGRRIVQKPYGEQLPRIC